MRGFLCLAHAYAHSTVPMRCAPRNGGDQNERERKEEREKEGGKDGPGGNKTFNGDVGKTGSV